MIRGTWVWGLATVACLGLATTTILAQVPDAAQGGRPGRDELPRPVYRVSQQPQPTQQPQQPAFVVDDGQLSQPVGDHSFSRGPQIVLGSNGHGRLHDVRRQGPRRVLLRAGQQAQRGGGHDAAHLAVAVQHGHEIVPGVVGAAVEHVARAGARLEVQRRGLARHHLLHA